MVSWNLILLIVVIVSVIGIVFGFYIKSKVEKEIEDKKNRGQEG